jgi:hypothetical protein
MQRPKTQEKLHDRPSKFRVLAQAGIAIPMFGLFGLLLDIMVASTGKGGFNSISQNLKNSTPAGLIAGILMGLAVAIVNPVFIGFSALVAVDKGHASEMRIVNTYDALICRCLPASWRLKLPWTSETFPISQFRGAYVRRSLFAGFPVIFPGDQIMLRFLRKDVYLWNVENVCCSKQMKLLAQKINDVAGLTEIDAGVLGVEVWNPQQYDPSAPPETPLSDDSDRDVGFAAPSAPMHNDNF